MSGSSRVLARFMAPGLLLFCAPSGPAVAQAPRAQEAAGAQTKVQDAAAALAKAKEAAQALFLQNLQELGRASAGWGQRAGPERQVVDQVCLVPDLPTFLEAIATWDDRHYFPVLIDDVEYTLKFLRAFQPARVVRLPRRAAALSPGEVWDRAVAAVGQSWSAEGAPGAEVVPGDAVPRRLGATPPGVVLASPEGPALAGAVALAAGRFQPLLRFETPKR